MVGFVARWPALVNCSLQRSRNRKSHAADRGKIAAGDAHDQGSRRRPNFVDVAAHAAAMRQHNRAARAPVALTLLALFPTSSYAQFHDVTLNTVAEFDAFRSQQVGFVALRLMRRGVATPLARCCQRRRRRPA